MAPPYLDVMEMPRPISVMHWDNLKTSAEYE